MFKQPQINVLLLGLVENMAYLYACRTPVIKFFIFGEVGVQMSEEYEHPFLGQMPLVQSIREVEFLDILQQ